MPFIVVGIWWTYLKSFGVMIYPCPISPSCHCRSPKVITLCKLRSPKEIISTTGIEMTRIMVTELRDDFGHFFATPAHLIPQFKHGEWRLASHFIKHAETFGYKITGSIIINLCFLFHIALYYIDLSTNSSPMRKFGQPINADYIGRLECSQWRTPCMTTYVIEAIIFIYFKNTYPLVNVHWRISGMRKYRRIVLAPHKSRPAVYHKALAVGSYFPHSEIRFPHGTDIHPVYSGSQSTFHPIKRRRKLIPCLHLIT